MNLPDFTAADSLYRSTQHYYVTTFEQGRSFSPDGSHSSSDCSPTVEER